MVMELTVSVMLMTPADDADKDEKPADDADKDEKPRRC